MAWDNKQVAGAISLAEDVGRKMYLHVGALGMPEMQRSYILGSTRRGDYDGSQVRMRRHLLLNWSKGFFKSTQMKFFFDQCTPSLEITNNKYSSDASSFLWLGDYTIPKLRGSVYEAKMVRPLIQRPRFLLASELADFLGMGEGADEMNNFMCRILEEGEGRVAQVAMAGMHLNPDDMKENLARGISVDEQEGIMSYRVQGAMIAATRPLDYKYLKKLDDSGFLDRFNVIRWHHDKVSFLEQHMWVPPDIQDVPEVQRLREINQEIWSHKWDTVKTPPRQMVQAAMKMLNEEYVRIEEDPKRSTQYRYDSGLRTARDNTNLSQLLTSEAIIDNIANTPYGEYQHDKLEYYVEQLDRLKLYLPAYVQHRMHGSHGAQ